MPVTSHQPRSYRRLVGAADLVAFEVAIAETDLMVLAREPMREQARGAIRDARRQIESHATLRPEFLTARSPLAPDASAPEVPRQMYEAARVADTGPMAAVAGVVAEFVARRLASGGGEVIVENGGDLFIISARERTVSVRAPGSPLDGRLALVVPPGELGVCTSSGTVGHSASAGRADAVVIAADAGALADALATATANRVHSPQDIEPAIEWARSRAPVRQVVVICGGSLGAWGQFELRQVGGRQGDQQPERA